MNFIDREKSEEEVNMLSPLIWAYVGDGVYEMYVRMHLVNEHSFKPHKLHIESIKYVKAKAQSDILHKLQEDSFLTEEELDIVRRARNTENHHVAKNASVAEYTGATSFEALIGYLYLCKRDDRLKEILDYCMKIW